jgi:hypothetical protein
VVSARGLQINKPKKEKDKKITNFPIPKSNNEKTTEENERQIYVSIRCK